MNWKGGGADPVRASASVIMTEIVFVPGVNSEPKSPDFDLLPCNVAHPVCVAGLLSDWYPNLDALKESCRIASSYNWADVDLSPFQGAVWSLQVDLDNIYSETDE